MSRAIPCGRLLGLAWVALLAAGAAPAQTDSGDYERQTANTRAALIAADDADSLAAAALLDHGATGLDLIARASAQAPQRPELAWLHAQLCAREKSCNLDLVVAHLRAIDPRNGVAWSEPFSQTTTGAGSEQSRARLAALANAERFDVYWNSLIAHTTAAIIKTRTMETPNALIIVIGGAAAEAIPAYQWLTALCRGDALLDAEVLADCRRLSGVLRRGDTYITEMVGTAIAKKAWRPGDPEYQDALRARRTVHYRMEMLVRLAPEIQDEEFASRYLQLIATHRTEQEVSVAQLAHAGIAPNPPDDWHDPQEQ